MKIAIVDDDRQLSDRLMEYMDALLAGSCEWLLFPSLAVQNYRWSFLLMLLAVETLLAVPLFLYMKRVFTPAVEKEPSGFEWRYLWLIPATFYVMW